MGIDSDTVDLIVRKELIQRSKLLYQFSLPRCDALNVEVHEIDIDPVAFLPVEEVVTFSFTRIKTREIGRSERAAG